MLSVLVKSEWKLFSLDYYKTTQRLDNPEVKGKTGTGISRDPWKAITKLRPSMYPFQQAKHLSFTHFLVGGNRSWEPPKFSIARATKWDVLVILIFLLFSSRTWWTAMPNIAVNRIKKVSVHLSAAFAIKTASQTQTDSTFGRSTTIKYASTAVVYLMVKLP